MPNGGHRGGWVFGEPSMTFIVSHSGESIAMTDTAFPSNSTRPTYHRFRWRLAWWSWMYCAVPAAVTLLSFGARSSWICDGLCHFHAQYFVALVPGLVCFIGLRAKRSAGAVSVLMLLNVVPFVSLAPHPGQPAIPADRHYRFVLRCCAKTTSHSLAKLSQV